MSLFGWKKSKTAVRKATRSVRLHLEALEDRLVPTTTTYTVAAGDVATLIADIQAANANGPTVQTTINLTKGNYDFTAANNNTYGPNALPAITGDVVINGNGATLERDSSLGLTPLRFFYVSGGQTSSSSAGSLTLENLTLQGGFAEGGSSGTGGGGLGAGGAIYNQGNLTLNGVTATGNIATGGSSGAGLTGGGGGGIGQAGQGDNGGGFGGSGGTPGSFGEGGAGSSTGNGQAGGIGGGGGDSTAAASGNTSYSGGAGGFGGGGGSGANQGGAGGFGAGGGAASGSGGTGGAGGFGAGAGNGSAGGGGLGAGGVIFNQNGTTTVINSTLTGNLAAGGQSGSLTNTSYASNGGDGYGGAVFNLDGTLNIVTSTLAYNSTTGAANGGGAVYNLASGTTVSQGKAQGVSSTVTLTDNILADSVGGNSVNSLASSSDLVNDQYNSTAGSAVINATTPNIVMVLSTIDGATTNGTPNTANPNLSALANNGGYTETMALASGSPALGAGVNIAGVPATDQRGVTRGSVIDLGAYEGSSSTSPPPNSPPGSPPGSPPTSPPTGVTTTLTLTSSATTVAAGQSVTLTANVASSSSSVQPDGYVTFVDTTNSTTLETVAVIGSNGQAEADLETNTLPSGTNQITVTYQSTDGLASSNSSFTITVGGGTTSNSQWLSQVYQDLLDRPIDPTGANGWGAMLSAGVSRGFVAYLITQTPEYETDQINAAYQQILGAQPDSATLATYLGEMQSGANIRTIESQIAGANSYYVANGDSPTGFLGALYQTFLNRPLDSTGSTDYQALLAAGQTTTQVAAAVLDSQEYATDMVQQDYKTYLNRAADPTSLAADVTYLMAGGNNDVVVATMLGSL